LSVDPLAEKYPNINPYVYVGNNPINAIDPDGRDIIFVIGGSRYKYDGKNLYNGKGAMVNPKSLSGTQAGKIFNAYNAVGKLDKQLDKQIQTLVNSKNVHLIDVDSKSSSGGGVLGGNEFDCKETSKRKIMNGVSVGSTTSFNFDESTKKSFEDSQGISNSPETTVAHELRHQYDYEIGNMADSYGKKGDNNKASEGRAVNNENIARNKLRMPIRKDYEGKKSN